MIVQNNIDEYGWHVINVLEDDQGPSFSYSIGLYKSFGHPEVIFIGLKIELAHLLINNIGESIREGFIYENDKFYTDILDNYKCRMLKVDEYYYNKYVGRGLAYYNASFPLFQCIYPTVNGIYPWEKELPEEIRLTQPILRLKENNSFF